MLQALIVDDEELSGKRLKLLLEESGKIASFHMFTHPMEAYEFVKDHAIDVAFLDISMPEINGMRLSSQLLDLDPQIDVVFVTGHDNYAVQAFDINALDYLMKPVRPERLAQTLDKLRNKKPTMALDAPVAPTTEVVLFDGLRIYYRDGMSAEPIKLRSPKTEELFAYLVCKKTVSREEVIDTLWNGLEPDKALKNLNSTLYYIRKAIGKNQSDTFIQADRAKIWINESGIHCDLYQFQTILMEARRAPEPNPDWYVQAEALYKGELLKGKSYDWVSEWSRQLEQHYIELLEAAARYHLKSHQKQQALHYFGEILKLDAMREDIHLEVITLYMELGRRNDALRHYHELEELLLLELGSKPDPSIKADIMKGSDT